MNRIIGQLIEGFGVKALAIGLALYAVYTIVGEAYGFVAPVLQAMGN